MTVDRLRAEVSMDEFLHWKIYYARIGQRRELERNRAGV